MKTLIIVLVIGLALNASSATDQLEEIAGNWYRTGFICGQADMAAHVGHPIPAAQSFCAKWNARFKNGAAR
jgi:hypothetical protein